MAQNGRGGPTGREDTVAGHALWSVAVASFAAAFVEFVEALTIVLAMGLTRGWRSALSGTAAAVATLAVVTAVAGFALADWLPRSLLQLLVGVLLLAFGLQWLRKAVLRSAGLKALHDEEEEFREQREAGDSAPRRLVAGLDWYGFVVSYKGVLLEGAEVVFIVITFGVTAGNIGVAAGAAGAAGVVVILAGAVASRPLSRVPENTLKYAVGLMLATYGTFWAVEGLSVAGREVSWPGGDWALLYLLAGWFALSRLLVTALRPTMAPPRPTERVAP
jgi:Ca2+/H+ antiporter, TMEM165/GDT1 family